MPETTKLHYGKYLYKMQLHNRLAHIFRTELQRNGKLSYAASNLVDYKEQSKSGYIYKSRWGFDEVIPVEDLKDAEVVYRLLKAADNYMVRVELNSLIVYSNDIDLLENINSKLTVDTKIWKPREDTKDFLLNNKNVILVNTPPEFPYKISFGRLPAKKELANWIIKNKNKVVCGPRLLSNLKNENKWIQGQYIFAKDEKVILLLQMLIGDNISRIDKLVYDPSIDK